jgi:DNA processing protein
LQLSDEQRLDWLRLIRSERIGPRSFRALVNQYGGARAALDALPELGRKTGRLTLHVATRAEAECEMAALARLGGRFIALGEAEYPRTLQATDTAPPLIAVRGNAAILQKPSVAIVGSRNASAAGGAFAERLAADLGQAAYVVVSGLARGIDTRAHRAALKSGTVAVLAGGLERVYPRENIPLLDAIVEAGGAAVCEMPIAWEPRGRDFPRRNRIVSGLSYGVVVIEAAHRSGSLITSRFALEQGREVFAVPGSPLDPRAEGTNALIRAGATLVASADHVTAVLDPLIERKLGGPETPSGDYRDSARDLYGEVGPLWDELDLFGTGLAVQEAPAAEFDMAGEPEPVQNHAQAVLALLSAVPVSVDDLARQAVLPVRAVQQVLVELELGGHIDRSGGSGIALRPTRPILDQPGFTLRRT